MIVWPRTVLNQRALRFCVALSATDAAVLDEVALVEVDDQRRQGEHVGRHRAPAIDEAGGAVG
ncbi:hypothetical protein [Klebsiella pneumoniae]|uniref:hypothetical protein n=1 Tax=Klebsiella pneumoniae TaxID=573 RepID=UPI003D36E71F